MKEKTIVELKAMIYDILLQQQLLNKQQMQIENLIIQKQQDERVEKEEKQIEDKTE